MVQDVSASARLPRVAFVTGGLKLGGSTTFLCNLGGELVRRGIPAEVSSFENENPLASDFETLNVPVFAQDARQSIFEDRLLVILQRLRQFQPTAVLACLSAVSFEVLRYLPEGVFRIGVVQSDDPGVYQMVRHYSTQVHLMAAVSAAIKDTLEHMQEFANVRTEYLPYGVPMPATVRPCGIHHTDPLRILYLGRLEQEQKRVRLFPKILEQLRLSGFAFHWTIAGDGPEKPFLQSTMQSSRNLTVSFPGKVLYKDVPQVLREHDIFLLASDYEGLPLSLLEAMAWGLVPVVSDLNSGISEVVDESTGKRIPLDDLSGYAKGIIWLHQNRSELHRLSQNAQEKVRRDFSVAAMSDRWLKTLPATTRQCNVWPERWSIKPPLVSPNAFRYSLIGKLMRRVLFRLRSRLR